MPPLDLTQVRVFPLAQRRSLSRVEDILVEPGQPPAPLAPASEKVMASVAQRILEARQRQASVILMYGAHLLRNGAAAILEAMMARGWLTHLATNGAGSIHDWEFAFCGKSTESVRENVIQGRFGTWDETGRYLHLALLAGGLRPEGYGPAIGRMIMADGLQLPSLEDLRESLRREPDHPLSPARADALQTLLRHKLGGGFMAVPHAWKKASILAQAFRHGIPATVHPGIGYDIIATHPMHNGAVVGRAAGLDFQVFAEAVDHLEGGVVMSIGSAIMAPQVFEKSLSCVNNLRLQAGRPAVHSFAIEVVDLQDGGNWDWTQGEPAKTNPAYYLRFCKSFSRMGGAMRYTCMDNLQFVWHLYHHLLQS